MLNKILLFLSPKNEKKKDLSSNRLRQCVVANSDGDNSGLCTGSGQELNSHGPNLSANTFIQPLMSLPPAPAEHVWCFKCRLLVQVSGRTCLTSLKSRFSVLRSFEMVCTSCHVTVSNVDTNLLTQVLKITVDGYTPILPALQPRSRSQRVLLME